MCCCWLSHQRVWPDPSGQRALLELQNTLGLFFLPFHRQSLTRPKPAGQIKRTKELKEFAEEAVSGFFNNPQMPKGTIRRRFISTMWQISFILGWCCQQKQFNMDSPSTLSFRHPGDSVMHPRKIHAQIFTESVIFWHRKMHGAGKRAEENQCLCRGGFFPGYGNHGSSSNTIFCLLSFERFASLFILVLLVET